MDSPKHSAAHTPDDRPLEPWMAELAREAVHELEAETPVPREMMWARINRDRRAGVAVADIAAAHDVVLHRTASHAPLWRRGVGIAALLVGGVAIGRYIVPMSGTSAAASGNTTASGTSTAPVTHNPEALASLAGAADPAHVAMGEHLARTVSLLTAVRDRDPADGSATDVAPWARELLGTTRLLLDNAQLRDERTRRLLQDLELVLVQIIQARGTAPETQRAPGETMRETNLLPRVRAIVTASRAFDEQTYGEN